jgi:hypothetical protein
MIVERYQLTACAGAKAPFNDVRSDSGPSAHDGCNPAATRKSRCGELGHRTEGRFEISSLLVLRV